MHTIQSVAEKTGLTPDVIRVWERRYNVVSPERTASNQRLYTDHDIERLSLLRRVTEQGRRISAIARLSNDELRGITSPQLPELQPPVDTNLDVEQSVSEAIAAITELNPSKLEGILQQAFISLGSVKFMMRFVAPLMDQVGDLWRSGAVRTCQEHFSSAHVRSFLGRYMLEANTDARGPRVIVATLPGQLHELGATMSAVVAAQGGWNVIYLGASVPVEEILFSAECKDARAIGISLGYPTDDPNIPTMLEQLSRHAPASCRLLVGGSGVERYGDLLSRLSMIPITDLQNLAETLDSLR